MTADKPTIIKMALLCLDGAGHLLVVRKRGQTAFILPGGKPETGDGSPERTLRREVKEELGCTLNWVGLTKWRRFDHEAAAHDPGSRLRIYTFFGSLVGNPVASSEIEEIRWIDICNPDALPLASALADAILPALAEYQSLRPGQPHP